MRQNFHTPSATIYLGSGGSVSQDFKDGAFDLGRGLAARNLRCVYGGMSAGTMGILAQSVLDHNGEIIGVIPTSIRDHDFIQGDLVKQNRMIVVDGMWERKKLLADEGDLCIVMPGGYGTIDEVFEYLHWRHMIWHEKPVIFCNINAYWSPFLAFMKAAGQAGTLSAAMAQSIMVADTVDDALDMAAAYLAHHDFDPHKLRGTGDSGLQAVEEETLAPTSRPILIEDTDILSLYKLANALVLKQLGKHTRPIGIYDKHSIFSHFNHWADQARDEKFITPPCRDHYIVDEDKERLQFKLAAYQHTATDLTQKWS